MSDMDLSKTMGYDALRRDGAKALQKTLLAADRELIDGDIQRDREQLISEMAKGIRLGGGKMTETMGVVRLGRVPAGNVQGARHAAGLRVQLPDQR